MMNKAVSVILIVAVFGAAQGSVWSSITGWASSVGNFFKNTFTSFKDLFASDETTLQQNVNKTQTLLATIQGEMTQLMLVANSTQKTALGKVNGWAADLKVFAANISAEGQSKFEQHKTAWQAKLQAMFQTDNLQSLLPLINSAESMMVSLSTLFLSLGVHFYLKY